MLSDDTNQPTLVIFCKRPLLNQGKQRLRKGIGPEAAYKIAVELLNCTMEDAIDWPGRVVLTVSKSSDIEWAKSLIEREILVLSQTSETAIEPNARQINEHCQIKNANVQLDRTLSKNENLGVRINNVDNILRAQGHDKLVFIGTDAPMLSAAHYMQIMSELCHSDIVLSKADDGGVGIMANAVPWPNLEWLPWSTSMLCEKLRSACTTAVLETVNITPSFDVDTVHDLIKLYPYLKNDMRISRQRLIKTLDAMNLACLQETTNQSSHQHRTCQ